VEQNFVIQVLPASASTGAPNLWANPTRITADDGSEASYWEGAGTPSGALNAYNFPMPNLPAGAVVDGLALNIKGRDTATNASFNPVALNISGSDTKTIVLDGITGGPTDLWGLSQITQSDLDNLMVTITGTSIGGVGGSLYVDCVYVLVYWHLDLSTSPAEVPTRIDYKTYSKTGTYLGLLPNVTSKLAFTQDINSGGSSLAISCAKYVAEEVTDIEAILDNNGDPLLTESDQEILAHTTTMPFALGASDDDAIYKNGNRVQVWVYNKWHPNGKLVFSGQVNKVSFGMGAEATVELLVHSDGLDLAQNLVIPVSSYSLTPDVSQTSQSTYTDLYAYTEGAPVKGPTSWRYVAQSFTAGAINRIGAIDLMLQGYGDVTVTLSIGGSNEFLGAVTQYVSAGSPTVTRIYFNTPITITPGALLVFNVTVPIFGNMRIYRSATDVYSGGTAFLADSGSYVPQTYDLYFVTQSASLGDTTVTYTSQDPITGILSAVLADYNTRGGVITERDFDATGLSLTYTFNQDTIFDAIGKMLELAPSGYYAYVDLGTAEIDVLDTSDTADFTIVKGRDVHLSKFVFSIENVKNNLYFSGGAVGGGDNLYKLYQNTESVANFGVRAASKSDGRVTLTPTADAIGDSFIAESSEETQETTITILNNTLDITLFTPGKTIGFKNFGKPFDDMILQIVRREPNFTDGSAVLAVGRLPLNLSAEIQRINRELQLEQTLNNPTAPS